MRSIIVALLSAALSSGCASVVRGTSEKVVINAEPADATIRTSLGHSCASSPCTVEVSRRTEFSATAKKPGYKPGSIHIGTRVGGGGAAGFAGNVLVGGVIGMGVDAATGATLDHFPNPALIKLEPVGAAAPAAAPKTKADGKPVS